MYRNGYWRDENIRKEKKLRVHNEATEGLVSSLFTCAHFILPSLLDFLEEKNRC